MMVWIVNAAASPIQQSMKVKMKIKSNLICCVLGIVGILLAGSLQCFGDTLSASYQFGPGTSDLTSVTKSINLPARTNLNVLVTIQRNATQPNGIPYSKDIAVKVELLRPNGTTAISQDASASFVGIGIPVPVIPMPGVFSSQKGCPDKWKLRVRTSDNSTPAVRIFGTVTFNYFPPGTVNVGLTDGSFSINAGSTTTKPISGHDIASMNSDLIAGTGVFHIKAKWHTDPLDVFNFGKYFQLTVRLLRPDGTIAASEVSGFSQHSPSGHSPKVNFTYTVTAADAAMSGDWKIRAVSSSGVPKIVGFDIQRGLDPLSPSFNSTFKAQCSSTIAIS